MSKLLEDPLGNHVLDDFLSWLVQNTKESGRFHVVMASSESFFHEWITSYTDGSYFNNVVIGHLSKAEVSRYWELISSEWPEGVIPFFHLRKLLRSAEGVCIY